MNKKKVAVETNNGNNNGHKNSPYNYPPLFIALRKDKSPETRKLFDPAYSGRRNYVATMRKQLGALGVNEIASQWVTSNADALRVSQAVSRLNGTLKSEGNEIRYRTKQHKPSEGQTRFKVSVCRIK